MKRIADILTLTSPLSHGADEKMGTDTKFRTLTFLVEGEPERIPVFSGNAIRGIMRRLIALDYLTQLGIDKIGISPKLYYMMFSGGSLEKGSTQDYIEVGSKREMRKMIPFMSLFGGATGNQIMSGKMNVDCGIPVCAETVQFTGIKEELSFWDMMEEVFFTRKDDLEDKDDDAQVQQMKYSVECLVAGTRLQVGFTLNHCDEVEEGCFNRAYNLLREQGRLGGKSAIGMGKFTSGLPALEAGAYSEYVNAHKVEMVKYVKEIQAKKNTKKGGDKVENSINERERNDFGADGTEHTDGEGTD